MPLRGLRADEVDAGLPPRGGVRNAREMIRRSLVQMALLGALGGSVAVAQSTSLSVANGSFESPVVTGPLPVDIRLTGWTKTPAPSWFVPQGQLQSWDQLSGVFPNPPAGQPSRIPNADGNQAAYLLTLPLAGFSQVLPATFEAGVSYDLTVGVRGGGNIVDGTPLMVSLFYLDASFQPVTLASTTLAYNAGLGSAWPALTDVSASTGFITPNASALGRNVGVSILSVGGMGEGYWDLDNVRVTATVVPEPGVGGLMALGGLVGGAWMWARRRR